MSVLAIGGDGSGRSIDDVKFWRVDPKKYRPRPGLSRPKNLTPLPDESPADEGPPEDDFAGSEVLNDEPEGNAGDGPVRY